MSDPYHEHEDRLLIEEHSAHPERFQKVRARPTPETDEAWKAVSRTKDGMYDPRVPISAFAYAMSYHAKKMERERDEAREERDRLKLWKDGQMRAESVWNPQEVGTLLGMTLGTDIRANIAAKISELIEQRDRLAEALTELRDAKWLSLPGRAGDIIESALTTIKQ